MTALVTYLLAVVVAATGLVWFARLLDLLGPD